MSLVGVRMMARMAGGKPAERGKVTEWEIVEDLGDGQVVLEARRRGGTGRTSTEPESPAQGRLEVAAEPADPEPSTYAPPATVRIERTVEQLRDPAWRRVA